MNYTVNNFFNDDNCSYFLKKALEIGVPFNYNPNENWDCRRIYDEELKLKVYNKSYKYLVETSGDSFIEI